MNEFGNIPVFYKKYYTFPKIGQIGKKKCILYYSEFQFCTKTKLKKTNIDSNLINLNKITFESVIIKYF